MSSMNESTTSRDCQQRTVMVAAGTGIALGFMVLAIAAALFDVIRAADAALFCGIAAVVIAGLQQWRRRSM